MREKLLDLMKSEGLKSSQLAEMLGINPAGISHILAGRNKPGFDLLQKILRRFPRINPDWLLLDSGPMYRDDAQYPATGTPENLSAASSSETVRDSRRPISEGDLFATPIDNRQIAATLSTAGQLSEQSATSKIKNHPAAVKRIVIFYEDETFESYAPTTR
ncbi:helix-turn-helix transcriptional regulator [uncultured Alistipes sp.]|jgi:transcriptional regulator with XRE-family HTH domain|uniref:helix-turn-helix domain-containing protein n=1 Tax=uncultured Alistipes sp. TaxID=538949 RepID=UPI0025F2CD19|nr:helix-turn-helix transcriptional regulator [uncultured Alistipes sp.]